jgi:branched-chain amino acid aminotransferase
MGLKVYLNGEFVDKSEAKVSILDHGLLYGDGVFEGIRSYSRKVFRLDDHIWRLYKSAESIRLNIPMLPDEFKNRIIETLKINNLDDAYIRVVVSRGVGDLGLDPRKCKCPTIFIITDKIVLYPEDFYKNGLAINIAKTKRNHPLSLNPRVKSLNYLNNILAKIEAIDAGLQEALMLSIDGHVAECTGDNIFIVKDGRIKTPSDDVGSLSGITQKAVIELAEKRGIKTEFKKMFPEELYSADECFLTGTAAEIIPVIKIEENRIGAAAPGRITRMLLADFKKLTKTDGEAY